MTEDTAPQFDSATSPALPPGTSPARESTLTASDGHLLHTYEWTSPSAEAHTHPVVVIMHGYGEYCGRYDEFARFLVSRGHPVSGFDARGHGQTRGQRGHVTSFQRYIDDLEQFVVSTAQRRRGRPLVLLGHSQGGLLSLLLVEQGSAPIDALIVTDPMVGLQPSQQPIPDRLALLFGRLVGRLPLRSNLKGSELTHDVALADAWEKHEHNHGWTTPGWYAGALGAMQRVAADIDKVKLPTLILQGELDPIVDGAAVARLSERISSPDREFVLVPGACHEPLNELDRAQTYERIARWLAVRFGGTQAR